jgi:CheY-like chemotaxis protein
MNENDNFALVPMPPSAVEKTQPGTKRILSGIVVDALALVKKERLVSPRIVLVDDESVMLDLIQHLIRSWFKDAAVIRFLDGETAWRDLLQTAPDVLVTDMLRPGMSGWDMLPLLADRKVEYPIILITGYGKEKDPQDGKTLQDVQDMLGRFSPPLNVTILPKPFDNEVLRKVLQSGLRLQSD